MNLILKHLWNLPNIIVSVIYLGFLWACRQIKPVGNTSISIVFEVEEGSILFRYMEHKWLGWASGAFIVVVNPTDPKLVTHENCHIRQQMKLGIFFIFAYLFDMLSIKLFKKDTSPYLGNIFEILARQYAANKDNYKHNVVHIWE
jgi:hypothetical protein